MRRHRPYPVSQRRDLEQLRSHYRHLLDQAQDRAAEGDDQAAQIAQRIEGEIRAIDYRLRKFTTSTERS